MNAHTARIEAGSVHVPRRAAWLEDFCHEISAFPATKYDDQIDALSQGLDRAFTRNHKCSVAFVPGMIR